MKASVGAYMSGLWRGESVARVALNHALASKHIEGRVADIGGGRDPAYLAYLQQKEGTVVEPVDGSITHIDFETDPLPYKDGGVDTVLLCNILEHIYNHRFLLDECARILRPDGAVIGFVPFMVGFHPDPQDYFRYTETALKRLFAEAGFEQVVIENVGSSPLFTNLNTIILSLPRPIRPFVYLWYAPWDWLFLKLRPQAAARTPLGYMFEARKPHA
jgi:SAM-dependent methyltransferase